MTNRATGKRKQYGISKSEILRGHDAFRTVFSGSQSFQSRYIRCYYRIEKQIPPYVCMVGFAVRKAGGAVHRNRARRFMRESWRCKKHELVQLCEYRHVQIHSVFLLDVPRVGGKLHYSDVDAHMKDLLFDLIRLAETS